MFGDELDCADFRLARPRVACPDSCDRVLEIVTPAPAFCEGLSDRPRKKVITGRRIQTNICNGFLDIYSTYICHRLGICNII